MARRRGAGGNRGLAHALVGALTLALGSSAPALGRQNPSPDAPELEPLARLLAPVGGASAEDLYEAAFELVSSPERRGIPRGLTLVALSDAARARGLDALSLAWIDSYALSFLRREALIDEARAFGEVALSRAPPGELWSAVLRTEYADLLRHDGRYRDALGHLSLADEAFERVRAQGSSAPEGERALLGVHLGVLGECWLGLGLPDVATPFIEGEGDLALELADRALAQSYHDHRMKLAQAQEDYEALDEAVEAALSDPLLAQSPASFRARLAVRRLLAQVELERRAGGGERAARTYAALVDDPDLDEYDRHEAHVHGAFLAHDRGDEPALRSAIARVRASPLHDLEAERGFAPEYEACLRGFELELAARAAPEQLAECSRRFDEAYARFLGWWRAAPEREGGVGFLAFARRRYIVDAAYHGALLGNPAGDGPTRALQALLAAQSCGSLTRALGAPTPTPQEAVARLAEPGRLLLCYLPGRARSHLAALSAAGVRSFALGPPEALDAARREFETRLFDGVRRLAPWGDRALQTALAALREALLPPELRELIAEHRSLVLIGLESLGYTPFEVLPGRDGEPLGWTHAVHYAPSLAAALALRERSPTDERREVRIAAPHVDGSCASEWGLAPFETPRAALDEIERTWAGRARVLHGTSATRAALEALDARVLQVVTHGYFDVQRELSAALLLASGTGAGCEPWWSEDAPRLRPPSIVVLSACGAWRGPRRRGDDGRASFAGQWIAAGAAAVVLPLSELELERALALGVALHKELAQGREVAAALTEARRKLARAPGELALQHLLTHVFGDGSARGRLDAAPPPEDPPSAERSGGWRAARTPLAAAAAILGLAVLSRRRAAARRGASDAPPDAR